MQEVQEYHQQLNELMSGSLELDDAHCIRMHVLFTFTTFLNQSTRLGERANPEGDIEQYIEEYIDNEYESEDKSRARAIIHCGAIDMLKDMLARTQEAEKNKDTRTVFDDFPSPTWWRMQGDRVDAQRNITHAMAKVFYLTGQVIPASQETKVEALIAYLDKAKEMMIQTVGLYNEEATPDKKLFLKNWKYLSE